MFSKDHISVCICTYKRPDLLHNLLRKLVGQNTKNLFTYSVVIVDNDINQSAQEIVSKVKKKEGININYFVEPEQNISLARNKAIQHVKGNLIAFIDDDEYPNDRWLINLYMALKKFKANGVFGSLSPVFEKTPPRWIKEGKFFDIDRPKTGTVLNWNETRTSNVLLTKNIFIDNKFDPLFGRTGGEDTDFFKRVKDAGFKFISCKEAVVYQVVSQDRLKIKWGIKRALRVGMIYIKINNQGIILKMLALFDSFIKSLLLIIILPISSFFGKTVFIKYLYKLCANLGKVLGIFGFSIIGYK